MEQYITAGLIGSLITITIQAIINAISERVKHKRELRYLVFQRKLEVVKKAISWYQETLDMYYMLQTALKEYDKDCNPITVQKIQVACMKSNKLFQETESRLNSLYLYYDFSEIEKKYHGRESMEIINRSLTLIAKIGQEVNTIKPSEFAEQLCETLCEERVKVSHMLADAIDNQVFIIAEIGQKLRTEYKNYLK